jgi:hypothetical protein
MNPVTDSIGYVYQGRIGTIYHNGTQTTIQTSTIQAIALAPPDAPMLSADGMPIAPLPVQEGGIWHNLWLIIGISLLLVLVGVLMMAYAVWHEYTLRKQVMARTYHMFDPMSGDSQHAENNGEPCCYEKRDNDSDDDMPDSDPAASSRTSSARR